MLTATPPASRNQHGTVHHWPGPKSGLSGAQARAAMRAFLSAMGWEEADFDLQIDEAPLVHSGDLGADRVLTVRRRSTGLERIYVCAPLSAWLAELLQDVERGEFGGSRGA
jgi:hypothetical protein